MQFLFEPWPWYVAGPMITLVMLLLLWFGKTFGVSSNLRSICSMMGAGKIASFFDFNWKVQSWNLVFIAGGILGGFIAKQFLFLDSGVALNENTVQAINDWGINYTGEQFLPSELFGSGVWSDWKTILYLLVGGVLVGFGTRYAGGCTSGHAISGLSNLQLPSLVAVIGFFIGGLVMTHLLLPVLVQWVMN